VSSRAATTNSGIDVPAGVYFYRVRAGDRSQKGKWVVLR
jgi:hypothetical protein